ncbi:MAG: MogA/MoaB family molybdenum cofactor biosynthesis protein [Clostridia bacterium]|nr:MogA/MoaB family molybdenum cofactor biosynthesis protein [Clostridia bacterium]
MAYRAAVVILSDKGYHGEREDKSGPALQALLSEFDVLPTIILPDDRALIEQTLIRLADEEKVDVVFTSGGTGLAPRDVTPEATLAVVDRLVPGIPEAMRLKSLQITNRAMLTRSAAGVRGRTLIINLPGSPKAVAECMEVVLPVMDHALETLRGEAYECARQDS